MFFFCEDKAKEEERVMMEVNVGSVGSKCSIGSISLIGYFCTMQPLEHIEPFQQVFQSTNYPTTLSFFFKFLNNCKIAVIKKTAPITQLI